MLDERLPLNDVGDEGEGIGQIRELRAKLEKGGITAKRLQQFDAMFHSYERNRVEQGKQDFADSQIADFYRIFALDIAQLHEGGLENEEDN